MWKFGVILFAGVLFLSSCCCDFGEEHRAGVIEAVGEVVSSETWERYVEDYVRPISCEVAAIVDAVFNAEGGGGD